MGVRPLVLVWPQSRKHVEKKFEGRIPTLILTAMTWKVSVEHLKQFQNYLATLFRKYSACWKFRLSYRSAWATKKNRSLDLEGIFSEAQSVLAK